MPNQDSGPYQLSHVLRDEFRAIANFRASRSASTVGVGAAAIEKLTSLPEEAIVPEDTEDEQQLEQRKQDESSRRMTVYQAAHDLELSALCLSGGGIRSASFALGIMQGLADKKLLRHFHYLSTVSGGGYIGSWLSSWLRRSSAGEVLGALCSRRGTPDRDAPAIEHLREYSSFLTPKLGLLSADVWAALAILVRNMLLNWLILVPALCLPVILVKVVAAALHTAKFTDAGDAAWAVLLFGALLVAICIGFMFHRIYFIRDIRPAAREQKFFLILSVGPAVVAGFAAAWLINLASDPVLELPQQAGFVAGLGALVYAVTVVLMRIWAALSPQESQPRPIDPTPIRNIVKDVLSWIVTGLMFGVLVWGGALLYRRYIPDSLWFGELCAGTGRGCQQVIVSREVLLVIFGMPWVLLAMRLGQMFYVMLRSYSPAGDFEREWLGRAGGWHLIPALAWIVLSSLVFLGTVLDVYSLHVDWMVLLGAVSGLAVRFLGKSSVTPSGGRPSDWKSIASNIGLAVAGPLFAAILTILLSMAFDRIVVDRSSLQPGMAPLLPGANYASEFGTIIAVIVVLAAVMLIADYLINVNRFSLHALYRNRLIRAFLGAGRGRYRRPDGFTGFDQNDNMRVAGLWPSIPYKLEGWQPFHVINMALNLSSSRRLAWQHRKAMSFTATPLFCGAADLGYRRTAEYGNPDGGMSLGTAMAISGAAVSPNMGYHSSPSIAFLLTLFNVRLGWWLGNPGPAGGKEPFWQRLAKCLTGPDTGSPAPQHSAKARFRAWLHRSRAPFTLDAPRLAARPLFAELLGMTHEGSPFVYLSDGGHFENLGIYEMVRRRCRWIVAVDGGQDPDRGFVDLGNAARKIWIDLGVRIRFADSRLLGAEKETKSVDVPYFALGAIQYVSDPRQADDKSPCGWLLYIKPTVRGDEAAADIIAYQRANRNFPHQSTGDQWFDEPQLEAYRALGHLIVTRLVGALSLCPNDLAELFSELHGIDPTTLAPRVPSYDEA